MDQVGCAENDPNGPVFDPVHGVIHHFYQAHLAAEPVPGGGPIYGHFVSKDFVNWAQLPVAIWNGLDASVDPPRITMYDRLAIYSGSAVVVDGAGPDGKGPGIVNIYPGLCRKEDWDNCTRITLLAQAVPADYANDELLIKWTKPSYNPIVNNTERDPSTPWRLPNGEWRLVTYDAMYGSASDADLVAGKWYELGPNPDFRTCECPSFYPLPRATPGFEAEYDAASKAGGLPTHVHKTSCWPGDWWHLGTYDAGAPKTTGSFTATPGWEDLYDQRRVEQGAYFASKDNLYPTKNGSSRRINWGWAQVAPQSAQSLPREITFNALTRTLEQAPIEEMEDLRGPPVHASSSMELIAGTKVRLVLGPGIAKQCEVLVRFARPSGPVVFGVAIASGDGINTGDFIGCMVEYKPGNASAPFYEVPVVCGSMRDVLRLTAKDASIDLRIFIDNTFLEAYFQKGRVAMTVPAVDKVNEDTTVAIMSTASIVMDGAVVYPLRSIWVSPDTVRNATRVYGGPQKKATNTTTPTPLATSTNTTTTVTSSSTSSTPTTTATTSTTNTSTATTDLTTTMTVSSTSKSSTATTTVLLVILLARGLLLRGWL